MWEFWKAFSSGSCRTSLWIVLCITHLGLRRQAPSSAGSSARLNERPPCVELENSWRTGLSLNFWNIMNHLLTHSSYQWVWHIVSVQPMIVIIITIIFKSWSLNNLCTREYTSLLKQFYWSIVDSQCCANFHYTAKWFSYTYIYTFFFRFFSHLGYYRILSRVPCAIQ